MSQASVSPIDRLRIVGGTVLADYPEGVLTDEIERLISETLPVVAGLTGLLSAAERASVLRDEAIDQRAKFIAKYGDPFGCEYDACGTDAKIFAAT